MTTILAIDLASTTGWCLGEPGEVPEHGTIRFAKAGASHEAIFAKALMWTTRMCSEVYSNRRLPNLIVWEAPMATSFKRGSTNVNTTSLLFGLPAVVGAAAYMNGIFDCRKADARDVRNHFIGSNPKRAKAKPMVMRQCRAMGWQVEDDNEADACAVWHYMCSLIEPKLAMRPTPLFGRR